MKQTCFGEKKMCIQNQKKCIQNFMLITMLNILRIPITKHSGVIKKLCVTNSSYSNICKLIFLLICRTNNLTNIELQNVSTF